MMAGDVFQAHSLWGVEIVFEINQTHKSAERILSMKKKYVAYIGTYTHESSIGIHVYDMDNDAASFNMAKEL